MPKYRNDGATAAYLEGCGQVPPDRIVKTADDKYVTNFSKDSVFTVVEHAPAPWKTFHEGVLPVSITSGLARYSQIEIINSSGDTVTVTANADSSNSRIIPNGQFRIISQSREVDALSVTGNGSGAVYVYGIIGD
jgi:hypothetical protein